MCCFLLIYYHSTKCLLRIRRIRLGAIRSSIKEHWGLLTLDLWEPNFSVFFFVSWIQRANGRHLGDVNFFYWWNQHQLLLIIYQPLLQVFQLLQQTHFSSVSIGSWWQPIGFLFREKPSRYIISCLQFLHGLKMMAPHHMTILLPSVAKKRYSLTSW